MVNTKKTFHSEKKAMASSASCWREPFFFNLRVVSEQASERASWGEGGPEGHELDKSLRAVREQTSVDVAPVIYGQWRNFTDVGEQAEDR